MDTMRDFGRDEEDARPVADDVTDYSVDAPLAIGSDERRMQVRAYNHWVSLLDGRAYPSIEDLEPGTIDDFGPFSVLLDFTQGAENPSITYLGDKLRAECDLPADSESVADVPPRSLLSRLTDHYMQIIANRAPVGFEAEFTSAHGQDTMYRGILMPFSSDDDTIDFIYGVINWKELQADTSATLHAEVAEALAAHKVNPLSLVPVWNENPVLPVQLPSVADLQLEEADEIEDEEEELAVFVSLPGDEEAGLADRLAAARASADAVKHADTRSRSALYHALGQAYDFALVADGRDEEYRMLLEDTGLVAQDRAPMTPIVKLIFGADYDKTRLTEFAAALSYGKRHALPAGGMRALLDSYPGGLKAIVAADRKERRPAERPSRIDTTREQARSMDHQAILALAGDDEFVVLVARRVDPARVGIIGVVPFDAALLDRALRQIVEQDGASAGK